MAALAQARGVPYLPGVLTPTEVERALALGDRLGGHFVSGHIDGTGSLLERHDHCDWSDLWFKLPRQLSVQMAHLVGSNCHGFTPLR
mgnify:CR=1 FL=1